MDEQRIKTLFPRASKDTIALNIATGAEVSDTQSEKHPTTLDSNRQRKAQSPRCPAVRFTLRRKKLLDVDAKWGSVKDLLDGLQYAGIIQGDREGEITLEVKQEKIEAGEEETTIIEIDIPTP